MSSVQGAFHLLEEPFGLITPLGLPLPVNHALPVRSLTGDPDGAFISQCFRHLRRDLAEPMKTALFATLDVWWWRVNRFDLAPAGALDVFIFVGPVYECKFCAGTTTDPDMAILCVRGHINV
ncbi:SubName: Full=Uncharacterized protein {ECO:0000313/EMBL:CCA72575.1} [Serendipita indica DSM 11827]|uniref:Uncharacterized protein n=1 Tax=Serendipita indica (strain DSM 11827) TaxID=1109443 RepID=G4TMN2_SERID|nr:SubName: Full=Uncharacterized protein {ECO:0000313/EMBL:CCA72575.1} [Serendipita indica DSM 11827]CCA72575.1 hypothetical protein PIIN_06512 [Serendipita indica DSM 11827]